MASSPINFDDDNIIIDRIEFNKCQINEQQSEADQLKEMLQKTPVPMTTNTTATTVEWLKTSQDHAFKSMITAAKKGRGLELSASQLKIDLLHKKYPKSFNSLILLDAIGTIQGSELEINIQEINLKYKEMQFQNIIKHKEVQAKKTMLGTGNSGDIILVLMSSVRKALNDEVQKSPSSEAELNQQLNKFLDLWPAEKARAIKIGVNLAEEDHAKRVRRQKTSPPYRRANSWRPPTELVIS